MRLNLAALVALVAAVGSSSPALGAAVTAEPRGSSGNVNVDHGGKVPPGAGPVNVHDEKAVKARVKKLWAEVEKDKKVEKAAITHVYRDFGEDEWKMLPHSFTQRPYQTDFDRTTVNQTKLPSNFLWGYASASAQVEGAVKDDGRGPSVWDWFSHRSDGMTNGDTFDVATNFRYMYPLDIKRVAEQGAQVYSFSISWSRVMPLGRGYVSKEGLQFYEDLTHEIQKNGLQPVVTLQHWDIPLYLQINENGLQNETYADAFNEYADVVLKTLGPKGVKHWVSHNEPQTMCNQRYLYALKGVYGYDNPPPSAKWMCSGITVKAHGRMNELVQKYRDDGTLPKDAVLSFKNSGSLNVPWDSSSKNDNEANERNMEFSLGIFSDPIHSDKHDYPDLIKKEVPKAWLPQLTQDDKRRLNNSAQYYGSDWYSSSIVQALPGAEFAACRGNTSHPSWPACSQSNMTMSDGFFLGTAYPDLSCDWMSNTPGQFRNHLKYVNKRWPTPLGIIVTEIGWPERDEANKTNTWDIVQDTGRQNYYLDHLNTILESVKSDGVKIAGAWLWSATPNIEWEAGKTPRFGTSSINYTNPHLPRTYLGSAYVLRDFFKKHNKN